MEDFLLQIAREWGMPSLIIAAMGWYIHYRAKVHDAAMEKKDAIIREMMVAGAVTTEVMREMQQTMERYGAGIFSKET